MATVVEADRVKEIETAADGEKEKSNIFLASVNIQKSNILNAARTVKTIMSPGLSQLM